MVASYPVLTLNVAVSNTAAASIDNVASVAGGGETNTGNDTVTDSTTVNAGANVAPAITSANSTSFAENVTGSFTPTATGFPAPTIMESGTLPMGVTFVSGVLSGKPAAGTAADYDITFTASNGVGADFMQSFTLTVTATGSISGVVFRDFYLNGAQDSGEPGLAGQTVFLDTNNNGVLDAGETSTTTASNGAYSFPGLAPGSYTVRQVLLGGVLLSTPTSSNTLSGSYSVNVAGDSAFTNKNFGDVITSITVPLTLPPSTAFPAQGNANADFVEGVYRAVLNRNADPVGLSEWIALLNSNQDTRLQVVQGIRNSPEHFSEEIQAFYLTLLGRPADAAGLAGWVKLLESGTREETIAFDFLDSPEFSAWATRSSSMRCTNRCWGEPSTRPVRRVSSLPWGIMPGGHVPTYTPTMTHAQVINAFLFSPESLDRLVEGYYEVFLQRPADSPGLKAWVATAASGSTVLDHRTGIHRFPEFFNKAAGNH